MVVCLEVALPAVLLLAEDLRHHPLVVVIQRKVLRRQPLQPENQLVPSPDPAPPAAAQPHPSPVVHQIPVLPVHRHRDSHRAVTALAYHASR